MSGKGLFAVAVWGASFVATRLALRSFHPLGLVALRLGTGVLLLALLGRSRGGGLLPAPGDRLACGGLGIIFAGHLLLQAYGLRFTSAINTGWIIGCIPVPIALGSHLLFGHRLRPVGWAGLALGGAGVFLVTMSAAPEFQAARVGDLMQFASCFTWTFFTLGATGPISRLGPLRVTTATMAVAAVVVALVGRGAFLVAPLKVGPAIAVAFLGVVCSGLGHLFWLSAIHERGHARVASLLYLEPFFTLGTAWLVLREPIIPRALLGGLIVLAGVWLVARSDRSPRLTRPGEAA